MTISTQIGADDSAATIPGSGDQPLTLASPDVRAECAAAIGAEYVDGTISAGQRRSAEIVLKMFIEDTAEPVRAAIAGKLVDCPFLPLSLAQIIAEDVDTIAFPMIRGSGVFDDDELIAIVQSGVEARQVAVASRDRVSLLVSRALIGTKNADVVSALLANDDARIAEADLASVFETFAGNSKIETLIIGRERLPLPIVNNLLTAADLEFRQILEDALDLPGAIVVRICTLVRELLIVSYVRKCENIREVEALVVRLDEQGRLNSTLLLRALCNGDPQFFAIALARRSGHDVVEVRRIIEQKNGPKKLRPLVDASGWSGAVRRAFAAILTLYNAEKSNPDAVAPDVFAAKAVARLRREFDELGAGGLDAVVAEICWRL